MKILLKVCLTFLISGLSVMIVTTTIPTTIPTIIPTAQAMPLDLSNDSYPNHQESNEQKFSLETASSADSDTFRNECFAKKDLEGIEGCKNFIITNQTDATVWNRLGHILYGLEHYETSYVSFKHAIDLQENYALAWANICAALSKLGEPQQALDACNTSLKLNPDSSHSAEEKALALNNKAIALYSLERYQDSLDTLDVALTIKPDDTYLQINRAIILHILAYIPRS